MDASTPSPELKVIGFVEDLFNDAIDARERLRDADDDDCKIKDRITCLKYLEDIVKTYLILKKDATDDPRAAGATVRKYATAFTKNAAGGGKKPARRKTPEPAESDQSDFLDGGDDAA
jgi:hypothetical protein